MGKIKGIDIILHEKTLVGRDEFHKEVYEEIPVLIKNVLVGNPTSDDIITTTDMYGRKAQYQLAIPKGDAHNWENVEVEFFNQKWRTFGIPIEGIEENIPLGWNKKVWVDRYE